MCSWSITKFLWIQVGFNMIDNFKLIFPYLSWPSSDIFYWISIFQRRKDGNDIGADNKLLKDIYIDSPAKYWAKEQEIKDLCKFFNARAYIYLRGELF